MSRRSSEGHALLRDGQTVWGFWINVRDPFGVWDSLYLLKTSVFLGLCGLRFGDGLGFRVEGLRFKERIARVSDKGSVRICLPKLRSL